MQDINGYERFIGLLPGCYSMGVSHPETFVAGANLVLNSAEAPLTALTVYGHSTQSGTPSPENPVPIVSAGDEGEINVSISDNGTQSQTLTISTPGGLPGIPVSSGGNYTDESGQQWICDEVDFKRGKYVQRVWRETFDGSEGWSLYGVKEEAYNGFTINYLPENAYRRSGFSNQFPVTNLALPLGTQQLWFGFNNSYIYAVGAEQRDFSLEDGGLANWKAHLAAHPIEVMTYLETPIETDLTAEEIAAYKALHTYSPATTVSNDAGAWMKVGYYGLSAIQKLEKEALLINGGKSK